MDKTQLIFWIIVVVGAIVKWLYENADVFQGGGSDSPTPDQRSSRPMAPRPRQTVANPQEETEEEKMRRFLEALGLPPDGTPPVVRKPSPPAPTASPEPVSAPERRRSAPIPERPVPKAKPELPKPARLPQAPQPHIAPPFETGEPIPALPKVASVAETAPAMEVASISNPVLESKTAIFSAGQAILGAPLTISGQKTKPGELAEELTKQLRDSASLRRAILLKEILGTPKGLQSAESPSIFSPL